MICTSATNHTKENDWSLRHRHRRTISRTVFLGVVILAVYALLSNVFQAYHLVRTYIDDGRGKNYYYYFPSEPLYNIYSLLNESIGAKIFNDPQRNPLQGCSPTVQYRLILPSESDSSSTWILQSMMMTSTTTTKKQKKLSTYSRQKVIPKLEGGDEIYVQWEADRIDDNDYDYMGVAQVTDQKDGTYLLKFIRPPMLQFNHTRQREMDDTSSSTGSTTSITTTTNNNITHADPHNKMPLPYGRLTIYYEYTCGIGSIFAPNKDLYSRGGEVYQTLTSNETTTGTSSNGRWRRTQETTQFVPRPHIHDFVPPNTAMDDTSATTIGTNERIDLSQYDTVFAFGDSLIMQLVRRYLRKGLWSDNIVWYQNVYQCLSTDSDARSMLYKFHTRHGEQIRNLTNESKRIALLTGSSSWDAMRGCVHEDMQDHANAIRTYIQNVTTSFPNLDIYWKAPSAFFLHRYTTYIEAFNDTNFRKLKPKFGVKPLKPRYINYHVPRQLYHVQKELMMNELHIPFMDLYDSYYLSAPWTVPGDSRHFDDAFTRLQLSYYWPGLLNKPIYT